MSARLGSDLPPARRSSDRSPSRPTYLPGPRRPPADAPLDCPTCPGRNAYGEGACHIQFGSLPQRVCLAGASCQLSLDRIGGQAVSAALRDDLERLPRRGETGLLARGLLETAKNLIAIGWI